MANTSISAETRASVDQPGRRNQRTAGFILGVVLTIGVFLAGYLFARMDLGWMRQSFDPSRAILKFELPDLPLFTTVHPEDLIEANRKNLEVQRLLITNSAVLARTITDLRISRLTWMKQLDDPEVWLQGAIKVENPEDSQLLVITMTDGPVKDRPAIINAVVNSYLDLSKSWSAAQDAHRIEELQTLKAEITNRLKLARQKVRESVEKKDEDQASLMNDQIAIDLEMLRRVSLALAELEFEVKRAPRVSLISAGKMSRQKTWGNSR